jgi:CRISPR-associated exonuclease Cas4
MDTGFKISATHIAYYFVCHRKLWLYSNGLEMEHFSNLVLEGRQIHNEAYPRRASKFVEIQLDGIKIDFFDSRARVVHEIKRGRAIEIAHVAQVQYYLFKLWNWGIKFATGVIEYPELRRKQEVAALDLMTIETINGWEKDIVRIVEKPECPDIPIKNNCRNCAFFDLCHINEL